ncbi:MAG: T9SS type A sorting domain-containing protein [bacterium]
MKKQILNLFALIVLLCAPQSGFAEQWCSKTLTNGSNVISVSCEEVTAGSLYRLTIEGLYLSGFGGSFCNIYDASGASSNVLVSDYATVSADKTMITVDFPSSQAPYFYTPLYVMMPGEVAFEDLTYNTSITWGECVYEAIAPVMTSATLVTGSENHEGAQIAVAATDQTEEGGATTSVTNFKVFNGLVDLGKFTATNGVITVGGLSAETAYTVTVYAYDDVKNLSVTGIEVSFTTVARVEVPTTAATTPTEDDNVASLYSDAYTTAFTNLDLNAAWEQATTYSEVQIDGNNTILYSGLTYQGIEFDTYNLTGYATMHMDMWVADNMTIRVYPITGGTEQYIAVDLVGGTWNSVEIDIADYTSVGLQMANTYQFKIEDADLAGADLYIDNWYFYGEGTYIEPSVDDTNSDWCGRTLTEGSNTVEVSCELITAGELYRITVVGTGIEGLGGAFATIYDASGTANNIDLRDYMTVSSDNTTLTLDLPSSADPIFYTPLYVTMPGEVSFTEFQFADITWGTCADDDIIPVMTSATLVEDSETYQGAQITVSGTDQIEEGGDLYDVTSFMVMNDNVTVGTFTATSGVITVTGLNAETSYTVTVYAVDSKKNVSETGIDVSFTTISRVDAPTTAATTPTHDASDVLSLYSDAYTTGFGNLNINASWGQATVYSEVQIDGNNTTLYAGLTYQGIEFDTYNIAGYNTMHMDMWIADDADIKIFPITGDTELSITANLVGGQWNSIDINIADFSALGLNMTNVYQFKLENTVWASGDLYLDNWYFYGANSSAVNNTTVSTSVVYPNPATDFMIVEAESTIEMVTVYNIMGQTVSSTVGGGQSATISVSGLSVGNYIVRVLTADGNVSMHKLIKK